MKKDLLTTLSSFSFFTLDYLQKQLKFILILLFFYTSFLEAQTRTHQFNANGTLVLPAGVNPVTVEAWGAGGAGGGAVSTVVEGRGAGGGGGGAYAKGDITTATPQTLSIIVGTATSGTSGNGGSGGASYVDLYSGIVFAPGGNGGTANTSGGAPAGGPGGTSPIGATTNQVGSPGLSGASSLLGLGAIFNSGKGGNAGGTGGGAGGAALNSLLLGNNAGNAGSEPGGGGSGGMASLGATQIGGAGARGRVNITYTCKTYSFTGISASNACSGTSLVQLTGTAASLPAGTYTVTYNTSRPNAVGLPATMVVTTAGSGSFTATGLTTSGSSTITVTALASGDCSSTISATSVNITVSATPTITLGTATSVCTSASSQNATLPYTAVTNAPTNYSITWNASPTNTFAPVTNAVLPASQISIAVPAGTPAGTYTGTLTVNNGTCTSPPTNFNIIVNPLPTITLGATTAVCTSTSVRATTLPYTAVTNAPTTYSITWSASPTNTFVPVSNLPLPANAINISVPANTAAGTYTGTLTVKNAAGCTSTASNFTVTVSSVPTITLGSITPVCFSASAQTANLSYSAATNSPTTYSITWNASPTNSFLPVTNAPLTASPIGIAVPAGTPAGTYAGTITVKNAGCVSAAYNFNLVVNPLPTIALGATTAVCTNSNVQNVALPYGTVTNAPTTYSITWNTSPTNSFLPVTDSPLAAGSISIPVPANTPGGTYTGTLTVKNGNGCVSADNNFSITVNSRPTISLGTANAVCFSNAVQGASLSYSAVTNAPTTYSIVWDASPTNNFLAVTDANLTAGSINISVPAGTPAGNYTGTLTVKNASGCSSAGSNFTVTVNAPPTITLGTAGSVCFSSAVQSTSLNYSAVTNAPITYSIVWNANPTNNFLAVTDANLNAGSINISVPAGTPAGNYTGTLTVKNAAGCISAGNNFTVTVNAPPTITLGTTGAVCFSSAVQSTNVNYSAVTNSPTTYSIVWNASPTNNLLAVTDANLNAGSINISIPAGTPIGNYTGTLIVKNANGCVSSGNSFTVTVNAAPTIATSGNLTPVCQNSSSQIASLPYTSTTGSPISYSIDWALLNDQGITAFSFDPAGGNINNINVPANTAAGTYSGVMTIFTSNECWVTQTISLTVNSLPTINTAGVFVPVCESSSAQTTTLNYNSTTGSPVSYEIDWIALTDQGSTPFAFSSGSGDIVNVDVPANTSSGTYNGIMTITTSNGCVASQSVSLTVNPLSVAPTASVTQQPTCVNNTGIITVTSPASGTGYTYSIDGVDFSNTSGIFTGLSSGAYDVQVKNVTSGCESESTPIMINASITKMWNGSVDANWGNSANWTPTGVPIASDCIDIPDATIDPIISGTDASFFASRLTIQNNGSLIVQGSNTITVTNEVNVLGSGNLIFENNSSLVQIADVGNMGNITYKRNTTPVRRYDVTYWSSPVTREPAFTLYDLSPNTLWDKFHKYNPSTQTWILISGGTEEMIKGNGYSIRAPQFYDINSPVIFTGEFVGVPNNGTITGAPAAAEKLTFLGNPYPSAIHADKFIRDNAANLYGTLFFWTHNSLPTQIPGTNTFTYTSNDFAFYNLSGEIGPGTMEGTPAPTEGNQSTPAGYIAAGQGFFARSITGQSAVFTNSMRVANLNSQFYKSNATTEIERHRVWLNFTNTEGAFKQLLIGYVAGATNSWDNSYDAITLNANPYVDFYSVNEGKKLVIQGRAVPFAVSDTIPLGYKSTIPTGNFTIAIDRTDGDLIDKDIYLQDNVTKTIHNLKSGGYTFTSERGTFLNRFVLRYSNPEAVLGNEEFENQDQKIVVSVKDKNIKLQSISEQENLDEVSIYDVGGKWLYNKKEIGSKEWLIPNFQSGPQVLLVKITLDNGKSITKKIVFR